MPCKNFHVRRLRSLVALLRGAFLLCKRVTHGTRSLRNNSNKKIKQLGTKGRLKH
jgi:hypothetical protein